MRLQEPHGKPLHKSIHCRVPTQISAQCIRKKTICAKIYGAKTKLATPSDDLFKLKPEGIEIIQWVVDNILYYFRSIDSSILKVTGAIYSS